MNAGWLYLLSAVGFATLLRSHWPWRRAGGIGLGLVALLSAAAVVARTTGDGRPDPTIVAILLATLAFGAASWWALHQRQEQRMALDAARRAGGVQTAPRGLESEPKSAVAPATAAALAIVALAAWVPIPVPAPRAWILEGLRWLAATVGTPSVVLALASACAACAVAWRATSETGALPGMLFGAALLGPLPLVAALAPGLEPTAEPLALRVWTDTLGVRPPEAWLLYEAPGLLAMALVFVGLPLAVVRHQATRRVFVPLVERLERLGTVRSVIVAFAAVSLLWLPLRVAARTLAGVGAFVVLP